MRLLLALLIGALLGCAPAHAQQFTPTVTGSAANNLLIKASPGNLFSVYAVNLTATAGFLAIVNLTSSPSDGAITPLDCVDLPASGHASLYLGDLPNFYGTGIVAVLTSASTCFTKTTGTITGFISARAQ